MGRPRKEEAVINELERYDTIYWCGLIKASSGLSDAQIETKLDLTDQSGRNFNRWLTGKRAMNHKSIQTLVKKARKVGLLPKKKNLMSHQDAAFESHAHAGSETDAKEALIVQMKSLRELHQAKIELNLAAQRFQSCVKKAEKYIDIFDTILPAPLPRPEDALLETTHTDSIARRISEIASWYFLDGIAHDLQL